MGVNSFLWECLCKDTKRPPLCWCVCESECLGVGVRGTFGNKALAGISFPFASEGEI